MTFKYAWELVGGLATPSKMPCFSYSTPASRCKTGGKLHEVEDSVCQKCYALRGNYRFPVVQAAQERRFQSLTNPLWVEAMTLLIGQKEKSGFFRFQDSGDLDSIQHLKNIVSVALNLPHIKFWLPTREYGTVSAYVAECGAFPENLIVRLSAYMMEGPPPTSLAKRLGVGTSGVSKTGFTCPAPLQGNKCADCRACWQKNVENINYKRH